MRRLLKKIERGKSLTPEEYQDLLEYIETLRASSPEAYAVFLDQYASLLLSGYNTYIPRFACEREDFFNYLLTRPDLLHHLEQAPLPVEVFPPALQPYLLYTFGNTVYAPTVEPLIRLHRGKVALLPAPRSGDVVYKYEESNPYKEQGLKTHFERLARYTFITRLQSYRYLTRNKSAADRIEYVSPDRLGGIFTNKQKSIYYYIFLTEADEIKAHTACRLLNLVFYNRELA